MKKHLILALGSTLIALVACRENEPKEMGSGGASSTSSVSSSASSGGGGLTISDERCFFGPEEGSPVLGTEVKVENDESFSIRICKCEGDYQNPLVDVELWWYNVTSKERSVLQTWPGVKTSGNCTDWLPVTAQFTNGIWLEPRIISPSILITHEGPWDLCANESQCNAMQSLKDNTYRSTAFKVQ